MKRVSRIRPDDVDEIVDSNGSWAISYGDMITLLLSFFVLYFTVDFNAQRDEQLRGSLLLSLEKLKSSSEKKLYARMPSNYEKLPDNATEELSELSAKFHQIGNSIVIEFDKVSSFKSGEIEPKDETVELLKRFSDIYLPYASKYLLSVRAFTDSKKVVWGRRGYKDNLELSALRAVASLRVLQKSGIPLDRMNVGGFGENRRVIHELRKMKINDGSIDRNDSEAMARKVVLVISPDMYTEVEK